MKTHFKYIYFKKEDPADKRKTEVWTCRNIQSSFILGEIRWHGPWRQYCFFADDDTIFSVGCLDNIIGFIKQLMEDWRNGKEKTKDQ